MDLQPDTFACFGVRRIERVRIPSLRIRTFHSLGPALPIYCTNMHTFLLAFSCFTSSVFPAHLHAVNPSPIQLLAYYTHVFVLGAFLGSGCRPAT